MQYIRTTLSIVITLFILSSAVYAQGGQRQMMQPPEPANPDSVSETELKKFARVTDSAQSIQKEVQSQVQTIVEDEGMEFSRFQEIMMNKQNPQAAGSLNTSQSEEKTIKQIQPQLMKINRQAQQQFVQLIRDEGLTPQRFQQIMRGVQTNKELQQRLQSVQSDS
ncbi:MAG: DUF4168 domain-containing protein [Balneolaceae bacterium]|nr:DUF4168 domain-containing protein [Balneolaceae bacterium]